MISAPETIDFGVISYLTLLLSNKKLFQKLGVNQQNCVHVLYLLHG